MSLRKDLYRAKRADTREWVHGSPLFDFANCGLKREGKCQCQHSGELIAFFAWNDGDHEYDSVDVIPETIGQYIGREDLEGVMIFDGDIVEHAGQRYAVKYIEEEGRYAGTRSGIIFDSQLLKNCKVVGNIFDNQSLD